MAEQPTDVDRLDRLRRLATREFESPRDSEVLRGFDAGYASCQKRIRVILGIEEE